MASSPASGHNATSWAERLTAVGFSKEPVMVRLRNVLLFACVAMMLACRAVRADENSGQEKLDKATEIKLSAETAGDLNDVITLCQDALEAGLNESNTKFANELLAGTLTQRADLIVPSGSCKWRWPTWRKR
jgi:hypothetical protein